MCDKKDEVSVRASVDAATPRAFLQIKLTFILRVAIASCTRHSAPVAEAFPREGC
jgi:hypothetical protein